MPTCWNSSINTSYAEAGYTRWKKEKTKSLARQNHAARQVRPCLTSYSIQPTSRPLHTTRELATWGLHSTTRGVASPCQWQIFRGTSIGVSKQGVHEDVPCYSVKRVVPFKRIRPMAEVAWFDGPGSHGTRTFRTSSLRAKGSGVPT
jgi:hypothetical protein